MICLEDHIICLRINDKYNNDKIYLHNEKEIIVTATGNAKLPISMLDSD